MKKLIFLLYLTTLTIFLPSEIYGEDGTSLAQEFQKLKSENKELMERLNKSDSQLTVLKNNYDALKSKINVSNIKYDNAVQEIRNYKEYIDNKLWWVKGLLWVISFIGIGGIGSIVGIGIYAKRKFEKERNKLTELLGRLHSTYAYDEFIKYEDEADKDKRKRMLEIVLELQKAAINSLEEAYGTNLEKIDDRKKYILVNAWQNRAYYLAVAKDHKEAAWAIEKARFALEWGSGKRAFVPPKEATIPYIDWIDTYFFVLKTFKIPEFEKEWIENYEKWRESLDETSPGDPYQYKKYYEEIRRETRSENRAAEDEQKRGENT